MGLTTNKARSRKTSLRGTGTDSRDAQRQRLLQSLSRAQAKFIAERDLQQHFDSMVSTLVAETGSDYGFIAEISYDEKGRMRISMHACHGVRWDESTQEFRDPKGGNAADRDQLKTFTISSLEKLVAADPGTATLAGGAARFIHRSGNVLSFLGGPLSRNGRITGLLGLGKHGGSYSRDIDVELRLYCHGMESAISDCYSQRRKDVAEAALRDNRSLLQKAQQIANLGFWTWDVNSDDVSWSEQVYEIFGQSPLTFEPGYERVMECVHPDDRALVEDAVDQALRGFGSFSVDHRIVLPDGSARYLHEQGEVQFSADQAPLRMIGTAIDITEYKSIQLQLQHARQDYQRLAQSMTSAMEEERKRLARDIHDELGQMLTAIRMDVSWILAQIPHNLAAIGPRASALFGLIGTGFDSLRHMISSLRPPMLDDIGLAEALDWQISEISRHSNFRHVIQLPRHRIQPDTERDTAIFRIFQEGLTNIVQHSEATEVRACLEDTPTEIRLSLFDNGTGLLAHPAKNTAVGLIGMRERAAALGGRVSIRNGDTGGVELIVIFPKAAHTA